jgi:hypothetical protein
LADLLFSSDSINLLHVDGFFLRECDEGQPENHHLLNRAHWCNGAIWR